MKTLDKIRKYAEENHMIFKDFRKDSLVSSLHMEPQRYELLYPNTYNTYKGFDTQQDIEDFLKEEKENKLDDNKLYFPDEAYQDYIFGNGDVICITGKQLKWAANEWGVTESEVRKQVHEATKEEIEEYGKE